MPPLQVPGTTKPLRTLPVQVAAGGVVHVTPAQGSALQEPLLALQPKGHVCVLEEYVQLPPEQVPGDVDEVRTLPLHDGGGGVLQAMPVQGSGRHAPPLHPKGQVVSTGVYVQPLVPQVPGVVYERRVLPMQTAGGGVRQP